MSLIRPEYKMPLWVAVAIPAVTYLLRSILRGFDFKPDIPQDVIVFGLLAFVLGIVAIGRHSYSSEESYHELAEEVQTEDHSTDS